MSRVQNINQVVVVFGMAITETGLRPIPRFSSSKFGTVFMAKSWLMHLSHGQLVPL